MPAGAWKVYGAAELGIRNGTIDLDSNTFRMVLVTSSHTPNQSTHSTWADASANEASGTGYTSSGKLLTATNTRSGLVVTFDVDDQAWTSSTITAKYALIVKDADANGTLASTDALLCYCDLETGGGSLSSTAASFTITINASGVFAATAS
jgi:hypothetical protein